MRLISWNVNGIRAAIRKGFDDFVNNLKPDILMLQEIRCLEEQLPTNWSPPLEMKYAWHPAIRKGYSGVATLSNKDFTIIGKGKNNENDEEGRVLITKHLNLTLIF